MSWHGCKAAVLEKGKGAGVPPRRALPRLGGSVQGEAEGWRALDQCCSLFMACLAISGRQCGLRHLLSWIDSTDPISHESL